MVEPTEDRRLCLTGLLVAYSSRACYGPTACLFCFRAVSHGPLDGAVMFLGFPCLVLRGREAGCHALPSALGWAGVRLNKPNRGDFGVGVGLASSMTLLAMCFQRRRVLVVGLVLEM